MQECFPKHSRVGTSNEISLKKIHEGGKKRREHGKKLTILLTLHSKAWDWRVSREGTTFFHPPPLLLLVMHYYNLETICNNNIPQLLPYIKDG